MVNMKKKSTGEIIDSMIKKELAWHRRLYRFIFRPKNTLTINDIEIVLKKLNEKNK